MSIFLDSVEVIHDGDGPLTGAGDFTRAKFALDESEFAQPDTTVFWANIGGKPWIPLADKFLREYQKLYAGSTYGDTPSAVDQLGRKLNYSVRVTTATKLFLNVAQFEDDGFPVGAQHVFGDVAFNRPAPGGTTSLKIDAFGTLGGVGEPVFLRYHFIVVTGSHPVG